MTDEFPKPLTDEGVRAADVVITMGCGDACPIYPGKKYEDWEPDDPAGKGPGDGAQDPRTRSTSACKRSSTTSSRGQRLRGLDVRRAARGGPSRPDRLFTHECWPVRGIPSGE